MSADDIARVEVETYQTALDVTGNADPTTEFEARFSLPFVVSSAFVHGSVRLDAFTHERLADPNVRRLMRQFELRADPAINAAFPGQRAARVIVHTTDGRRVEFFQPTRKGDPDLPLSDAELDRKYRELAAPIVGRASAERLLDALWQLDSVETTRALGVESVIA